VDSVAAGDLSCLLVKMALNSTLWCFRINGDGVELGHWQGIPNPIPTEAADKIAIAL
jgi:hypothetical protein